MSKNLEVTKKKKQRPDWMPDIEKLRKITWPSEKARIIKSLLEENRQLFRDSVETAGSDPGVLAYATDDAVYFTCNSAIAGNGREAIELLAQELRDLGWYAIITDSSKPDRVMLGTRYPDAQSNIPTIESLCICSWPHRKGLETHTHFKDCPNVSKEKEEFQIVNRDESN